VAHFEKAFRNEFASVEPNLKLEIVDAAYPDGPAADPVSTIQLLNLLYALPHGVIAMSADIPDLVETSTNLAIIGLEEEEFVIATSQRSSVESSKQDIADRVAATLMLAGASAEHSGGYPGWKPNLNSRVLGIVKETYKERFGKEAAVKAIHAGLECGIIGEKFPGMDTVSMGPTIHGAHSPEERVSIDAVEKVWELVNGVLKKIAAG
jgi:dipeptidase D